MPTVSQCLLLMKEEGVDTNLSKKRYVGVNSNVSMPNLFLTSEQDEETCQLPSLFDISAGPNHRPYQLVVNGYQGTMSYNAKEHFFKWQIHSKDAASSVRPKRKISYTVANNIFKTSEKNLSPSTSTSIMKMMESGQDHDNVQSYQIEDKSSSVYLGYLGFRNRQTRVKSAFRKVEASDNQNIRGVSKDINFLPTPPGAPHVPAPADINLTVQTSTADANMLKILSTIQESVCTCSRSTTPHKQLDNTSEHISPLKTHIQYASENTNAGTQNAQTHVHRTNGREYLTKLTEYENTKNTDGAEYVRKCSEQQRTIAHEYVRKFTDHEDIYRKFEREYSRNGTKQASVYVAKERMQIPRFTEQCETDFVPIFIPTEHSYIESSDTDVTESNSSQEGVENSFTMSVDIQLKSATSSDTQDKDMDFRGCIFPAAYKLKKLPEPDPTAVCFSINDNMSHQDVISLFRSQTGNDVKSIQYDPVYIRSKCGTGSRWIVRLESSDVCKTVIKTGLEWNGNMIIVKSLDDVYRSEYTRYHKKHGSGDENKLKQKSSRKHIRARKSKTKSMQS